MQAINLLLSDARGIYIPRDFVEEFDLSVWDGINQDDIADCRDPDNEFYWESWETIVNNAEYHKDGHVWVLHHDGDLWAICYELMTDEEKSNFGFDD